jgi:hypothetical protein
MLLSEFVHKIGFQIDSSPLRKLSQELKDVNRKTKETFEGLEKVGTGIKKFGEKMTLLVTTPLVALGVNSTIMSGKMQKMQLDLLTLIRDQTGATESAESSLAALNSQLKILEKSTNNLFDYKDLLAYSKTLLQMGMPIDQIASKLETIGKVTLFDPEKIDQAMSAFARLQAGAKIDIKSIRALGGKPLIDELKNLPELKKYGPNAFDKLEASNLELITQKNLYDALDRLALKHANYTEEMNDLIVTSWGKLKNSTEDARIAIGDYIQRIVPIKDYIDSLAGTIEKLTDKVKTTKGPMAFFTAAVLAATGPVITLIGGLVELAAKFGAVIFQIVTYVAMKKTQASVDAQALASEILLAEAQTKETLSTLGAAKAAEVNAAAKLKQTRQTWLAVGATEAQLAVNAEYVAAQTLLSEAQLIVQKKEAVYTAKQAALNTLYAKAEAQKTLLTKANTAAVAQNGVATRQRSVSGEAEVIVRNAETTAIVRQTGALEGLTIAEAGAGVAGGGAAAKKLGFFGTIGAMFSKFFKTIGGWVLGFLSIFTTKIKFGSIFKPIIDLFKGTPGKLKGFFTGLIAWFTKARLAMLGTAAVVMFFLLAIDDVYSFFKGKKSVFGMLAGEGPDKFKKDVKELWVFLKGFFKDIYNVAKDIVVLIYDAFKWAFDKIWGVLQPFVIIAIATLNLIWVKFKKDLDDLLTFIEPYFLALIETFKFFYQAVKPILEVIWEPFRKGIEFVSSIWDMFSNAVVNFYKSLKAEGSPFKPLVEDIEKVISNLKFLWDTFGFMFGLKEIKIPEITKKSSVAPLVSSLPSSVAPATLTGPSTSTTTNATTSSNKTVSYNTNINVTVPPGTASSQIDYIKKAAKESAEEVFQTHMRAAVFAS